MIKNLDHKLFWTAIIFTLALLGFSAFFSETAFSVATAGYMWITRNLSWFIQSAGLGALILLVYLAFSKYGSIKLGSEDDKPEFSNLSYMFMMCTAGIGAALIFWAMGEPMLYYKNPPMFAEPSSREATEWLIAYPIFHWGPIGWAIFCLPAIPYAYYLHKKKEKNLRLSSLLSELIGKKHKNSWLGFAIDILAIFGTLGAFSTSMGFGANLLASGLSEVFGIPNNIYIQTGIVVFFVAFFGIVMFLGMHRGVEKVANYSVYAVILLAVFVLVTGPTEFILSYFVDSIGVVGQNFIRMSLWTDPVNKSGFPQDWTTFYWTWYFAYLIMMGIFLARISKGRTIRELIIYCICGGTIGSGLLIGIFGGYAVHGQITGSLPLMEWMESMGVSLAILKIIGSLTFGSVILIIFLIVEFFLMSTTMTSAAVALSMMTTKELDEKSDADLRVRMVWTAGVGAVSLIAFFMGGSIDAIKSMCVVIGVIMLILQIFMYILLFRWLKKDYPKNN